MAKAQSLGVVVVNYNYAEFVGRAIASVLEQWHPFDEVIVVDDGSTDSSMNVIKQFSDRVSIIERTNGGQLSACLAGLRAISTDYVCFLDSDDAMLSDMSSTVRAAMPGSPFKIQFRLQAIDDEDTPTGSVFPSYPIRYALADMTHDIEVVGGYLSPPTSGNVYRRQTLLGVPWDVLDLRDSPDGPINMVAPYLGEIVVLHHVLASYRVHGDSHSMWSKPTPDLLAHELEWFERRWSQACQVVGWRNLPFDLSQTMYAIERRLMLAALGSRARLDDLAWSFGRKVAASRYPPFTKAALLLWAFALLIPSRRLRRRLVIQRRSPAARGRVLQSAWLLAQRVRAKKR